MLASGFLQGSWGKGCRVPPFPHPSSLLPGFKGRWLHSWRQTFPLQASQALCTLLPLGPYKKAVAQFFPQLLMALMLQLFYSSNLRLMTEERPLWDTRGCFRLNKKCTPAVKYLYSFGFLWNYIIPCAVYSFIIVFSPLKGRMPLEKVTTLSTSK